MSEEYGVVEGTHSDRLAEAVERTKNDRERGRPRASTSERERFFAALAEQVKRAES